MTNLTIKLSVVGILLLRVMAANAQFKGTTFRSALSTGSAELTYVYNDVEGFVKKNSEGHVEGILVDLMEEFEVFLKSTYHIDSKATFYQVEESDFNKFMEVVKESSQGVFGLSNTSITKKREEVYLFSQPYMDNVSVLISNIAIPSLVSLESINMRFGGISAISVPSSSYLDRLEKIKSDQFPEMKIELVISGQEVIERVSRDSKAFAVVDLLYYLEFFKKGAPIKRHKIGDELSDRFGILMPKDSDWKPILDEFFESGFMKSSKYRTIVSTHFGTSAVRLISGN